MSMIATHQDRGGYWKSDAQQGETVSGQGRSWIAIGVPLLQIKLWPWAFNFNGLS
jgi:hypothetical protein